MLKILPIKNGVWKTSRLRILSPPPPAPSLHRFPSSASLTVIAPSNVASSGGPDIVPDNLGLAETPSSSVAKPVIPTALQPRVVIYDGVCHLCHRGVKWVINVDKSKKINFCCLQSEAAEPYLRLCGVDREDVLRRFIFIEGLGQYHQASTAALRVVLLAAALLCIEHSINTASTIERCCL